MSFGGRIRGRKVIDSNVSEIKEAVISKDCVRAVLDPRSSQCFWEMASRLKMAGPHVKFNTSQLLSFIVADFFATYFEKDRNVLIAEFFDDSFALFYDII